MTSKLTRRTFVRSAAAVALASAAEGGTSATTGASAQSAKGPLVYLDYDQPALDAAYDQSVWAPNVDRVRAQRGAAIEAALSRLGEPERLPYGPTEFERLDLYETDRANAPIHIFIHGGAWRGGNGFGRAAHRAEVFVRSGAHFIAPDYVLVQDAEGSLFPMVEQLRRAVVWAYQNAASFGGDSNRIYLSGHSAGGHLAGVLLVTDWLKRFDVPADIVKGGLCASGMFDLFPVSLSSRREYVAFNDQMIEALSPLRHLDKLNAQVVVSYGTAESPEFQRQSREFAQALANAGKRVELLVGEGYNHFEIQETLANPLGLLGYAALEQMGLTWSLRAQ